MKAKKKIALSTKFHCAVPMIERMTFPRLIASGYENVCFKLLSFVKFSSVYHFADSNHMPAYG